MGIRYPDRIIITITSKVSDICPVLRYAGAMTEPSTTNSNYGDLLTDWRKKRRFSQLSFALLANVSPRHVSFLETGRANPSREMVLKLADCLAMPKAEINRALLLAGYSPAYLARDPDAADLEPVHKAIAHLLDRHMPYPAIGLDRLWNITAGNPATVKLLNDAGFAGYSNLLEALSEQAPETSSIENWQETIGLFLARVQTELQAGGYEPELNQRVQKLATHFARHSTGVDIDRTKAVIPTRFRVGDRIISVFSTVASFGTLQDVTLDDLKIELMFPLDEVSKAYFTEA